MKKKRQKRCPRCQELFMPGYTVPQYLCRQCIAWVTGEMDVPV